MFQTVGLVWLCHKERLFSRGRHHSDVSVLPQQQPLKDTLKAKQCWAPNNTVKILMERALFTASEGIVEIPVAVENMEIPASRLWYLTKLTNMVIKVNRGISHRGFTAKITGITFKKRQPVLCLHVPGNTLNRKQFNRVSKLIFLVLPLC